MTSTDLIDLPLLERIASERRYEARTLAIAKRLFVDGETPKRLAVEHGMSLQRVYAIRKETREAAQALALPSGWEQVTFAGPAAVIAGLKMQHRRALADLEQDEDSSERRPA